MHVRLPDDPIAEGPTVLALELPDRRWRDRLVAFSERGVLVPEDRKSGFLKTPHATTVGIPWSEVRAVGVDRRIAVSSMLLGLGGIALSGWLVYRLIADGWREFHESPAFDLFFVLAAASLVYAFGCRRVRITVLAGDVRYTHQSKPFDREIKPAVRRLVETATRNGVPVSSNLLASPADPVGADGSA